MIVNETSIAIFQSSVRHHLLNLVISREQIFLDMQTLMVSYCAICCHHKLVLFL